MHPNAVILRQIAKKNVPDVVKLNITWEVEHMRRQIVLERGEDIRIELELKVVIVFGLVISLRAYAKPIGTTPIHYSHSHLSTGAGGSSLLQRPILILRRHGRDFTNDKRKEKKGTSRNNTMLYIFFIRFINYD